MKSSDHNRGKVVSQELFPCYLLQSLIPFAFFFIITPLLYFYLIHLTHSFDRTIQLSIIFLPFYILYTKKNFPQSCHITMLPSITHFIHYYSNNQANKIPVLISFQNSAPSAGCLRPLFATI